MLDQTCFDSFTFKRGRDEYVAELHFDTDHGAPWDEECGHGPVTDWARRDKAPGEMVLAEDRGARRFYDFAEACKIARRDGWGFLPGRLVVSRHKRSGRAKWRASVAREYHNARAVAGLVAYGPDQNAAIAALYALHRSSMSPRAYAAGAARADYERLRGWCEDRWHYCGVVVRRASDCRCCGGSASLWGIESDADGYLREVAEELAQELGAPANCA